MEIREIKPTSVKALEIKRVAAYARVSVEKQASLDSLSSQVSYYNEYIGSHPGWDFAGIYADYGLSGTKDNRPEFQRMLTDARAGKIDIIITKSIARFARNTVTLLQTVRELKGLYIEVIFENDNMSSFSPDVDLLMTLLAMKAEEESRSASNNKLWQIRKQFEQGIPTYHNLFGYRMVNHQFQIVEEEAVVVRRIFADYLSGMGAQAIARKLNEDGLQFAKKAWKPIHVYDILRNEKYAGNMLLQKKFTEDFRTKKQRRNRGERRQYYVEESHAPIIVPEVFNQVQEEIARRDKMFESKHKVGEHLFSRLIYCGDCGSTYVRKNAPTSQHRRFPVWMCCTFDELGKEYCSSQRIREEILIEKTREVLGLTDDTKLSRELVLDRIDHIEVPAHNILRYFLKSGAIETVEWHNPSRKASWTPEMRERARQKSIEQYQKKKAKEDQ